MFPELPHKLHILPWQEIRLRNYVKTGFGFWPQFFYALDVLFQQIFAGYLFVPKKVVHFLKVEQLLYVYLWPRPGP